MKRMEVDISERLTADVVPRGGVGTNKVEWLPAILDAGGGGKVDGTEKRERSRISYIQARAH